MPVGLSIDVLNVNSSTTGVALVITANTPFAVPERMFAAMIWV